MARNVSWSKRSHLSIEGLEVCPANGLEMAFDSSSPEGVLDQWSEKKKRMAACDNQQVTEINRRRMNWRKKVFGVLPVLWIAIGINLPLYLWGFNLGFFGSCYLNFLRSSYVHNLSSF
jgi:hypothetical protein